MWLSLKKVSLFCLVGTVFCLSGHAISQDGAPEQRDDKKVNRSFDLGLTRNGKGGWDLDTHFTKSLDFPDGGQMTGILVKKPDGSFTLIGKMDGTAFNVVAKVSPNGDVTISDLTTNTPSRTFSKDDIADFTANGFSPEDLAYSMDSMGNEAKVVCVKSRYLDSHFPGIKAVHVVAVVTVAVTVSGATVPSS